jgi:PII-like signaling protein
MRSNGAGKVVSIYIGNSDKWEGQNLYNAIVQRAREMGLMGATVTEGIEGFGANSRIHRASILDISTDLPVKVEIIDKEEQITLFLPVLDEMVTEGLITIRDCEIVKYVHNPDKGSKT